MSSWHITIKFDTLNGSTVETNCPKGILQFDCQQKTNIVGFLCVCADVLVESEMKRQLTFYLLAIETLITMQTFKRSTNNQFIECDEWKCFITQKLKSFKHKFGDPLSDVEWPIR